MPGRRRPLARPLAVVGASVMVLAGCATATPRNPVAGADATHSRLELLEILQPGDARSWVEDARWTELVIRLVNTSARELVLDRVELVDALDTATPATPSPLALPELREQLTQSRSPVYRNPALMAQALATLPYVRPSPPPGGDSAPKTLSIARRPDEARAELERRALRLDARLPRGGQAQGSLFFRYTSAPQKLVVAYRAGEAPETVELSLARVAAELAVGIESATLTTDQDAVRLGTGEHPPALGLAKDLAGVTVVFTRALNRLELETLRIGFVEALPCSEARRVEVSPDRRTVTLSEFPDGCLRRAQGFYELVVLTLNLDDTFLAFQKGLPPGTPIGQPVPGAPPVPPRSTPPASAPPRPPEPPARVPSPAPAPKVVYVKLAKVQLREGAGSQFKVVAVAGQGVELLVLEETGPAKDRWLKVKLSDDQTAWVSATAVSDAP
jgi:hypothetical protein